MKLNSRRAFFKRALLLTLPILGSIVITPLKANPLNIAAMACEGSCVQTCYANCNNNCVSLCQSGCKESCTKTCCATCYGRCICGAKMKTDTITTKTKNIK